MTTADERRAVFREVAREVVLEVGPDLLRLHAAECPLRQDVATVAGDVKALKKQHESEAAGWRRFMAQWVAPILVPIIVTWISLMIYADRLDRQAKSSPAAKVGP